LRGPHVLTVLAAAALGAIEIAQWSAPSCPASLLTPRLKPGSGSVRVSVQERSGGVLLGSLEVEREGRTRRRTHEATSCEALIDVLALGVELAQAEAPAEAVEPSPPPAAGPVAEPVTVTTPAPLPGAARTRLDFELGAHALVIFSPGPGALPGAELSASVLPLDGLFRIELSVQHARTVTLPLGPARGRFSLTAARLAACSPSVPIGPGKAALCGSVAAGAVWAQGFASVTIEAAQEALLPWVDLAPQARLTFPLPYGFRIDARLGPTFPLTRHTFVFERPRTTVHAVPIVGFEGGLGLSYAP
jgi:hypothetical protein